MDLVNARKRAKKKALEEKGEAAEKKRKSEVPADEEVLETSAPEKEPEREEAAASSGEETPPAASPDEKTGWARDLEMDMDDAPGEEEAEPPIAPVEVSEEDVFSDDAFGEDLPPLGLDEELPDEVELGDVGKKSDDSGPKVVEGSEDDEVYWEMRFEQMQREHMREESRKQQASEPAPRSGRAVEPPAPRPPASPGSGAASGRKPAEPEASSREPESGPIEGWTVEEPAMFSPRGPDRLSRVEVEWEDSPSGWQFGDAAKGDDNFFALVTEDLYMREFGRQVDDGLGNMLELLSFRMAREVYAVRLTSIRQIIKLMPVTTVPRSPEYVLGIISLRGNVIPVFDLRRRLNLPAAKTTRSARIVVVAEGRFTVGLLVDAVEQVVRIPEGGLEPPPSMLAGVEAGYIEGIGRHLDKMILVLALDKIMVPVTAGKEKR